MGTLWKKWEHQLDAELGRGRGGGSSSSIGGGRGDHDDSELYLKSSDHERKLERTTKLLNREIAEFTKSSVFATGDVDAVLKELEESSSSRVGSSARAPTIVGGSSGSTAAAGAPAQTVTGTQFFPPPPGAAPPMYQTVGYLSPVMHQPPFLQLGIPPILPSQVAPGGAMSQQQQFAPLQQFPPQEQQHVSQPGHPPAHNMAQHPPVAPKTPAPAHHRPVGLPPSPHGGRSGPIDPASVAPPQQEVDTNAISHQPTVLPIEVAQHEQGPPLPPRPTTTATTKMEAPSLSQQSSAAVEVALPIPPEASEVRFVDPFSTDPAKSAPDAAAASGAFFAGSVAAAPPAPAAYPTTKGFADLRSSSGSSVVAADISSSGSSGAGAGSGARGRAEDIVGTAPAAPVGGVDEDDPLAALLNPPGGQEEGPPEEPFFGSKLDDVYQSLLTQKKTEKGQEAGGALGILGLDEEEAFSGESFKSEEMDGW